jgi:hypothetical protein
LGEARESFRGTASVPALGFISVPYNYLRLVPGVDVAVGVTAYQMAASARSAVTAVSRGRMAVHDVANQISNVVGYAAGQITDVGELGEKQAVAIARHAARGAVHALDEVAGGMENVTRGALLGTVRALSKTATSPYQVMREIGFGAMQGAGEVGANVVQTATEVITGARQAAQELGISEEAAAAHAAEGIRAATESMTPAVRSEVEEALTGDGALQDTEIR